MNYLQEETFDWKETDEAILFLVQESHKGSDIYWFDIGDDSFHFIIAQQPTNKSEVKKFIISSYKKIGIKLNSSWIHFKN